MKRCRVWVLLLAVPALLLLVGAAIVWDANSRADAVIAWHRKQFEQRIAEYFSRPSTRPPLEGDGEDGNAWEIYEKVLSVLASLPPGEASEIPEIEGFEVENRPPDDEVLGVLYLKYQPELGELRRALNMRRLSPPSSPGMSGFSSPDSLMPFLGVARFIAGGISHYHRMMNPRMVLELSSLGLAFSQDVGCRFFMVGNLFRGIAESMMVFQLSEVLGSHDFESLQLEAFARRLDLLDARRPSNAEGLEMEVLFLGGILSGALEAPPDATGWPPGWRDLCSWRISSARQLEQINTTFELGRTLLARAPPDLVREVGRLRKQWGGSPPGEFWPGSFGVIDLLKSDVEQLLQRTLLRLSVAIAWYEIENGQFPLTLDALVPRYIARIPACPYSGVPFGYKDGKVWSVGSDGVDNGGICDPEDPFRLDKAGVDVVCTVKRRK